MTMTGFLLGLFGGFIISGFMVACLLHDDGKQEAEETVPERHFGIVELQVILENMKECRNNCSVSGFCWNVPLSVEDMQHIIEELIDMKRAFPAYKKDIFTRRR